MLSERLDEPEERNAVGERDIESQKLLTER
jgi:hypothetical protein